MSVVGSFLKLPTEVKDYTIDWSPVLDTGDEIDTSSWAIDPVSSPPLTEDIETETTTATTIWLSVGAVGSVYELTNTVVTTTGRTIVQSIQIRVSYLQLGVTSFIELDEADEYISLVGNATWFALSPTAKEQFIIRASRLLNRQRWIGAKSDDDQGMSWPRTGIDGVEVDEYPQNLKDATCELAVLLADGSDVESEQNASQKIQSLKAGSVSINYFRGAEGAERRFPNHVHELLRDYLQGSASILTSKSYGVDTESVADDSFGYNRGV